MSIGDIVVLKAKTLRGKNKINEEGDTWVIEDIQPKVYFKNNSPGPWIRLTTLDKRFGDKKPGRWVSVRGDINFIVEQI